ncbi:hypothetical protein OZX72_02935 [Bifidobacterium sp. ESL0769]|uniref:hypothetical protein n=1 Tax=Bifidobacterium sp. ESL0769 TaxID=2983229 RepID=UPI0023F64083|nr:hypothetical protein [Bifidobacterium sp. ESL0769]WEV67954.1 hypothetical protein OZX72_02935 [Bifidobacterium sp. ESL0769]
MKSSSIKRLLKAYESRRPMMKPESVPFARCHLSHLRWLPDSYFLEFFPKHGAGHMATLRLDGRSARRLRDDLDAELKGRFAGPVNDVS